jgi:predicted nucleic acid-binding protein
MKTLGIIDLAIAKGFELNKKVLVDRLMAAGFRISNKLYRRMFPGAK